MVEAWEQTYLRELARKQTEYAALPVMTERARLWRAHNDLQGERPMIYTETSSFEKDLLLPLKCATSAGKALELELKRNVLNHEQIGDDRVVSSYYDVAPVTGFKYFNITLESVQAPSNSEPRLGSNSSAKSATWDKISRVSSLRPGTTTKREPRKESSLPSRHSAIS